MLVCRISKEVGSLTDPDLPSTKGRQSLVLWFQSRRELEILSAAKSCFNQEHFKMLFTVADDSTTAVSVAVTVAFTHLFQNC